MSKVLLTIFSFFSLFVTVFATEDSIKIITRSEWGANESYRYINSPEWQEILKKRSIQSSTEVSVEQAQKNKERSEKLNQMNQILINDFYDDNKLKETILYDGDNKLAWPIGKTENIKSIVIHHTLSDFKDSYEGVRSIYKFHALTREWGDIGYNYLIGKNGEIFEGRAGGDYVVAAHDMWNNRSTLGIAIIGDYSENEISTVQRDTLKKLISYLVKKYEIDINAQANYHKECFGSSCALPLMSFQLDAIVGHRDAGTTSCPGEALYNQIESIKQELKLELGFSNINKEKLYKKLDTIEEEKLILLLAKLEELSNTNKYKNNKILQDVKHLILMYMKEKTSLKLLSLEENVKKKNIDEQKIKVKLSYPDRDSIKVANGNGSYDIERKGNVLMVNGSEQKIFTLKSGEKGYFEIVSWNRVPSWDSKKTYNDNKFRGEFVVYVKDNVLEVVNKIDLEDYLKGLGEVSNSDDPEKIKTIIIAARTYALWYMTQARKFEGEWYDASDDPNVFQKYLGYGLESRSENINRMVKETDGQVITYNGKLIKPWYSSQSDGKTLSFKSYCLKNNSMETCNKLSVEYPYLQSVKDFGATVGQERLGHGVGISGKGASYLASKGWTSELIIKYYLKGVQVN